jgi:hypothetical protein
MLLSAGFLFSRLDTRHKWLLTININSMIYILLSWFNSYFWLVRQIFLCNLINIWLILIRKWSYVLLNLHNSWTLRNANIRSCAPFYYTIPSIVVCTGRSYLFYNQRFLFKLNYCFCWLSVWASYSDSFKHKIFGLIQTWLLFLGCLNILFTHLNRDIFQIAHSNARHLI